MRAALLLLLVVGCTTAAVKPAEPAPAKSAVPEEQLQSAELRRLPDAAARALLGAPDGATRARAALAMGRLADAEAVPQLAGLLADAAAGESAAWALGRIANGQAALLACVTAKGCASAPSAARALSGPGVQKAGAKALPALVAALQGAPELAAEAGLSLGVLARNPDFDARAARAPLAAALASSDAKVRAGAAYALSRLAKADGEELRPALEAALRDAAPWTRSLAARAWGKQGLPALGLAGALQDPEWRVRVEAARGLATASGSPTVLAAALPAQLAELKKPGPSQARFAHVLVALAEAAAQQGHLGLAALPDPATVEGPTAAATVAVRCALAVARDRIEKQLQATPRCGAGLEPEWRSRGRAGALAAELAQEVPDLLGRAREALHDTDGRVRGAAAGAAGTALAKDLSELLADQDPYVVQEAAGTLAKDPAAAKAALEPALTALRRLAPAHAKGTGDPQSDALAALAELVAAGKPTAQPAGLPELFATPSFVLHGALVKLGQSGPSPSPDIPQEARGGLPAHLLRLSTTAGELAIDLRPGEARLTSTALAALARRGFYDNLTFHRVVADFVAQGGDPRGDGDGGPGWALPDEHTPLRFLRGTLGIATSGPETGGSQFFLCHSQQPHLDGRYTIAGELREGADVLDALQPGDTILAATAE